MVVLARRAGIVVAKLQHDIVVDGELQRVAYPLVIEWLVLDVAADNDGGGRHHFRFYQVHAVEKCHGFAGGLVIGVDLTRRAATVAFCSPP